MTDVTADTGASDDEASRQGDDGAVAARPSRFDEAPRASNWRRAVRFLETARHLKARQASFWAVRRGWGRSFRIPDLAETRIRNGVNWIKFDLRACRSGQLPPVCRYSLYQQLRWLERNLEHEIQANHLLKNAKSLFLGGA